MQSQFSDDLYQCFRDLVLARAGLHYPERKRADLAHGLGQAMQAGSYASFEAREVVVLDELAVEPIRRLYPHASPRRVA